MVKKALAVGLMVASTWVAGSSSAKASKPLAQLGTTGFRAPYFKSDGPQPFSTRRTRELQAARNQSSVGRAYGFGGTAARTARRGGFLQSSRRPIFFGRRSGRLR